MTDTEAVLRVRQYYTQGLGFSQRGQLVEAIDALRLALRTAPSHVEARVQLGLVLQRSGRPDEGISILDSGLARSGLTRRDRIRLLQQASACAATANRFELARAYLERALETGGQPDAGTLNQVAAVCCKGGHFHTGFEYFLKASQRSE